MPAKNVVLIAEDALGMSVLKRIIKEFNPTLCIHLEKIAGGFGDIKKNCHKYIEASRVVPHIVLTDLDNHDCPVTLMTQWGVNALPDCCLFRVAIKEIESWVLADRSGFASFLKVTINSIPAYPEQEGNPKEILLNLAKRSRLSLAKDLLPDPNSSARIGPFYNERLGEYVMNAWDIRAALLNADSLKRAIQRIENL